MVNNWSISFQNLAFPPTCLLCGAPGWQGRDLCAACSVDLPRIANACRRCAVPLTAGEVCGRCLRRPPAFDAALSPWLYADPLRRLILGLKFHQRLAHARLLGELLAEALAARALPPPQCLIPVPLHATRLRERGYNQALELARPIARRLQRPLRWDLCVRTRPTEPQTELPVERRAANVRGAFRLVKPCPYTRVAIVDDVLTTGHTVQELAKVLRRAGVKAVEVWTCARAAT